MQYEWLYRRTKETATGFKTYAIYNDQKFRSFALWNFRTLSNLQIHSGTSSKDPCVYYVRNCDFTPKMPDVLLFDGEDQTRPVCATAKFHMLKSEITLAVGEGCERNGASSLPGFSTDLTRDGKRREYHWQRSRTGKDACWDYRCLDEDGEVVARFENAGLQWGKSGDFRFVRSEGTKWEWLVLIAFLRIREKESRFAVYSHGVCI